MTDDYTKIDLQTITSLCKRRGFLFQSSEIYGGLASTWDYGPLGVELKNNVKRSWWKTFVWGRRDMVGLDAAILMHPSVWVASGHVSNFSDPMVDCTNCNHRFRADHLEYPDSVKVDASQAKVHRVNDVGNLRGDMVMIEGLSIDPPDGSTFLTQAVIKPGFDAMPTAHMIELGYRGDLLEIADRTKPSTRQRITPGERSWNIGFRSEYTQIENPARVLLQFRYGSDKYQALVIEVNLDSLTVTGMTPASTCANCKEPDTFTDARDFNLMFETHMGPVQSEENKVHLRPETAQGIFVNFVNVVNSTRRKPPFGIAQIGKAFRNEITTGNFIFRTREFEIMEIEFFVKPGEDEEWHQKWVDDCMAWYTGLGVDPDRLQLRPHDPKELAHYAKATSDIEYEFPWGWGEIQGIANRTDFDLKAHTEGSGESLTYFDEPTKERYTPYVIEPSAGVDRAVMTFLVDAYTEEEAVSAKGTPEKRVVLKLHPDLAPVKVAVLPLSRNERLTPTAHEVHDLIRQSGVIDGLVEYDDAQSIGRRYRRQDEIGTPLCVTVDFDTLDDRAVTIRDRDTMQQVRVPLDGLVEELRGRFAG